MIRYDQGWLGMKQFSKYETYACDRRSDTASAIENSSCFSAVNNRTTVFWVFSRPPAFSENTVLSMLSRILMRFFLYNLWLVENNKNKNIYLENLTTVAMVTLLSIIANHIRNSVFLQGNRNKTQTKEPIT